MKPPPFAYMRPETINEAADHLRSDQGAMVLAGGQSLVPMLNLRVSRPTTIVDISKIDGLDAIEVGEKEVSIGALATHSSLAAYDWPLSLAALPAAAAKIGYRAIRNRGTIGGSLAHADPAAELPALAVALDASIHLISTGDSRSIRAEDFFQGYYVTARDHEEIVIRVTIPLHRELRSGFAEFSRRTGDFALALTAVSTWAENGHRQARVVVGGLDTRPRRLTAIEEALASGADWRNLNTVETLADFTDPSDDIHGSADFKLKIGTEMVSRAIAAMDRNRT